MRARRRRLQEGSGTQASQGFRALSPARETPATPRLKPRITRSGSQGLDSYGLGQSWSVILTFQAFKVRILPASRQWQRARQWLVTNICFTTSALAIIDKRVLQQAHHRPYPSSPATNDLAALQDLVCLHKQTWYNWLVPYYATQRMISERGIMAEILGVITLLFSVQLILQIFASTNESGKGISSHLNKTVLKQ